MPLPPPIRRKTEILEDIPESGSKRPRIFSPGAGLGSTSVRAMPSPGASFVGLELVAELESIRRKFRKVEEALAIAGDESDDESDKSDKSDHQAEEADETEIEDHSDVSEASDADVD